jgi:hypothetical protein
MALLALVCLAACSGDGSSSYDAERPSSPDATAASDGGDDTDIGDTDDEPAVDIEFDVDDGLLEEGEHVHRPVILVKPGDEPRVELRLRPAEGVLQGVAVHRAVDFEQTLEGEVTSTSSDIAVDLDVEIGEVDDTAFELDVTYIDANVVSDDPTAMTALDELVGEIIDSTSILRYDTRGNVVDVVQYDVPESDDPAASGTMQSLQTQATDLAVAFPAEAIGVGGVWQGTAHIEDELGIVMTTTFTATATSIEGDRVTADIETSSTMSSADDRIEVDGDFTGIGRVEWDLNLPFPVSFTMLTEGTVRFSTDDAAAEQTQRHLLEFTTR